MPKIIPLFRCKLLHPKAKVPTRTKRGDAGFDLYVVEDAWVWPFFPTLLSHGVAVEIDEGLEATVRPRSSSSKRGIHVTFGTCDAGYRGSIDARVYSLRPWPIRVRAGDRIAQMVISPVVLGKFVAAEELSESDRGTAGYGSSGR